MALVNRKSVFAKGPFGVKPTTERGSAAAKIKSSNEVRNTTARFFDQPVTKIKIDADSVSMTAAQIAYISLNTTSTASSISGTNTAIFNGKTIATPPSGFTLGQEAFSLFINNTYIPNSQRTVSQSGSNINVVFVTNSMGYLLNNDDEVVLVGKYS